MTIRRPSANRPKNQKSADQLGPQTMFKGPSDIIDGNRCLGTICPSKEPGHARILFLQHHPDPKEAGTGSPYSSKQSGMLMSALDRVKFDSEMAWFSYCVKYSAKRLTAADEKWCRGMLVDEIAKARPDVVVVFGADALRVVAGPASKYQISACRGAFIDVESKDGSAMPFKVFPTFSLDQVLFNEQYMAAFERDLARLRDRLDGTEKEPPPFENICLRTVEDVESLRLDLMELLPQQADGRLTVALDCEWGGRNWMDPNRYFRTIQIGLDDKCTVFTIEVAKENGVLFEPRQKELFQALKGILEADWIGIVGHNVIADGEWLLSYGIDIRKHVVFDTMLAEYLIDSSGPFGLEELAMKYSPYGRYSWEVELWTKRHKRTVEGPESYGYAQVPHEMLLGYAALDVVVLFWAMEAQVPVLEERGYFNPRGLHGEHPSMFDTTMKMQRVLYELEINGLPTDRDQLDMLTDRYQKARSDLLASVLAAASAPPVNFPEFNPRSSDDVRELLFNRLGLHPVKTTEGDSWDDTMLGVGMDDEDADDIRAATDKTTLEILDSKDRPLVHQLLQFKRIDQSCKTWLRKVDDRGNPAGTYKQLWDDGDLHPRFSPLTATGRLRTSVPNCQNYPKQAEAYMSDIFGKGNEPPLIRTIVKPKDGWCMIEGDFCQAELFTLANLSQDDGMLKALTTPGLDLHDKTAIDSFGLHMFDEDGNEVSEENLVELAAKIGVDSEEYEHFMKTLTYVDQHGKRMTRAEFKSSIRVAAKAINFGLAYGRGAAAVSLQVKAQTGDSRSIDEIQPGIAKSIRAWKEVSYPQAWQWLVEQQQKAYDPGWIENPFGRRKWAHLYKGETKAGTEREFGNFPIQSTVSDAVQIAMGRMLDFMKDSPFPFRLQNQIHDAVMIETPVECIDQAKDMFQRTLAGIDIPIPGTSRSFRLGIDIDVYERWGVKMKH